LSRQQPVSPVNYRLAPVLSEEANAETEPPTIDTTVLPLTIWTLSESGPWSKMLSFQLSEPIRPAPNGSRHQTEINLLEQRAQGISSRNSIKTPQHSFAAPLSLKDCKVIDRDH